MRTTFSIVETFKTIQGEGHHAGTPAFFVRFSSCNMWSGDDATRERDAQAHGAECPRWCDTDFKPREVLSVDTLIERIPPSTPLIVLTGGEPLLQITPELVERLWKHVYDVKGMVAIETNGTVALPKGIREMKGHYRIWVTCSPKLPPSGLKLNASDANELKVVFPAYDPADYNEWSSANPHIRLFVQPEASTLERGKSLISDSNVGKAVAYCMENPRWRLSMQLHKILRIP